jgi:hypothetical protein
LIWRGSAGSSPSHAGHVSGPSTTGIRLCGSAHSSLGGRDDRKATYPSLTASTSSPTGPPAPLGRDLPTRSRRAACPPDLLRFIEVIYRHETAAPLTEGEFALNPLRLGVDVREADFDVLGTVRHEAPAQQVQIALAGFGIVADDRERVSRRYVP